jgi:hypothetical protein
MNEIALPDGRIMCVSRLDNLAIKTGGKLCDGYEYATIIQNIGEPEPNLKIRLAFQISFDEGENPKGNLPPSASEIFTSLFAKK